jgi:hypothetical protein
MKQLIVDAPVFNMPELELGSMFILKSKQTNEQLPFLNKNYNALLIKKTPLYLVFVVYWKEAPCEIHVAIEDVLDGIFELRPIKLQGDD